MKVGWGASCHNPPPQKIQRQTSGHPFLIFIHTEEKRVSCSRGTTQEVGHAPRRVSRGGDGGVWVGVLRAVGEGEHCGVHSPPLALKQQQQQQQRGVGERRGKAWGGREEARATSNEARRRGAAAAAATVVAAAAAARIGSQGGEKKLKNGALKSTSSIPASLFFLSCPPLFIVGQLRYLPPPLNAQQKSDDAW